MTREKTKDGTKLRGARFEDARLDHGVETKPSEKGRGGEPGRLTQAPRGRRDTRRSSQKSSSNPGGFQSKGLQNCSGSNIKKEPEGKDGRNNEDQQSTKGRSGTSLLLCTLDFFILHVLTGHILCARYFARLVNKINHSLSLMG